MATKKAKQGAIEILPAEHPDVVAIETDGGAILSFMRGVGEFFRVATQLEQRAKDTLTQARALVEPTTQGADEQVQTFIRIANGDRKDAEAHWSICQTFSQVHRRLTAARGRTTTALEDAAAIAQRHHNAYADKERRRAAAEQERLRVEAENRAREARDRELAAAEQQALDLEAASTLLSEREKNFVCFYVLDIYSGTSQGNAVAAARRAGYKNPDQQAMSLMERPKLQKAIAAARQAESIRTQVAAKRDAPLDVQHEIVKPEISRTGRGDRTTHSGEVLDEAAFIAAVIAGKHGIPWDVLQVNPVKLNVYARSLQERLNLWPGVVYRKTTTTV